MGAEDVRRQKLNVFKMRAMGTEVRPVTPGRRTRSDAINEAQRDWLARVGPEHSYWKDTGRVRYTIVDDREALDAFRLCARLEGILPALETSHAVVEAMRIAANRDKNDIVLVCFSGRGDKDCYEVARLQG